MTEWLFFRRLRRNKAGWIGFWLTLLVVLVAVAASVISPYDPTMMFKDARMAAPGAGHLFGTDELGRDVLSRILYGARVSIQVGLISVAIGVAGGTFVGLVAGYYGGWVDAVIMRGMDILFAFPSILLALGVVSVLGPSLTNTMLAIGIVYIPIFARVVRASVLEVRSLEYIQAAKALGMPEGRILWRHILPNALAPLLVQATLSLSGAILTEASLSFLGLGVQPPNPSWGSMLAASRRYMELAPWTTIFPALATMFTVLGFNLLGDGLRDVLDPRLKS
jgi:peptide/nickel transport system permease protein